MWSYMPPLEWSICIMKYHIIDCFKCECHQHFYKSNQVASNTRKPHRNIKLPLTLVCVAAM